MKYLQDKYILDENGNPKGVTDIMEWTDWIENRENRKIAYNWFEGSDSYTLSVSTEFTGTDRNSLNKGPMLLFETRVFDNNDGSWENLYREYSTKEEALKGHAEIVKNLSEE